MPQYRRAKLSGGTFFFTVAIANRSDDLLVREIERFRRTYRDV
jgi:putative transposase